MSNDKLKFEIEDLKQVIFKQKSDFEMKKWEQSKNDLDFLKELQRKTIMCKRIISNSCGMESLMIIR